MRRLAGLRGAGGRRGLVRRGRRGAELHARRRSHARGCVGQRLRGELRRPSATRSATCSRSATASSPRTGSRRRRPPTFVTGSGRVLNAQACSSCHTFDGRGLTPDGDDGGLGLLVRLSVAGQTNTGCSARRAHLRGAAAGSLDSRRARGRPHRDHQGGRARGVRGRDAVYAATADVFARRSGLRPARRRARCSDRAWRRRSSGWGCSRRSPRTRSSGWPTRPTRTATGSRAGRTGSTTCAPVTKALGRFGWKANQPTVEQQAAGAFLGDIGITSSSPSRRGLHAEAGGLPTRTRRWIA